MIPDVLHISPLGQTKVYAPLLGGANVTKPTKCLFPSQRECHERKKKKNVRWFAHGTDRRKHCFGVKCRWEEQKQKQKKTLRISPITTTIHIYRHKKKNCSLPILFYIFHRGMNESSAILRLPLSRQEERDGSCPVLPCRPVTSRGTEFFHSVISFSHQEGPSPVLSCPT